MKTHTMLLKKSVLFLFLAFGFAVAHAQDSTSVKTAVETKHFVFKAQTALPTAGTMRQLSGEDYMVRVSGDSLASYLPYFGRAYTAPIGREGGIKFKTTQSDYAVKARRKGGWDIRLRPKDVSDVRELLFTVSDNGYASLRVLSNNRQPISFNGTVQAIE
jgi:hypothetical protein